MNREQVLAEAATITDVVARPVDSPNPRVTLIGDNQLAIKPSAGARSIPLSAEGSKALLHMVGMTERLRSGLSGATLQRAATEMLVKQGAFTVLTKDNTGVDFLTGRRYIPVDPERALRTMERVGISDFHRVYPETQSRSLALQAVGDRVESVVKGDRVQAGVSVTFSPIGTIETKVNSFSLVLACTNGMTLMETEQEYTYTAGSGGGQDANGFWEWFQASLRRAYDGITVQTQRFREMREHRIAPGERAAALEGMLRQSHISGELAEAIRGRALAAPPRNAWEMFNLITWGTTHATQDYHVVRRSHRALSDFSRNVAVHKVCPLCNSQN